ncbi:RES domain-containing protein [Pseudarcicella hirudinis]|uniref:RES domain-containing protein n=1 Tax=Pseudarcicella hirudinis TaxID=1079859 RepID=A0A1I5M109_9BACT|nr:RES family NAD+ phosphorylase [Pseudarcicella hirudinis]SFP03103.1 RES domain-containing protein [Pseudarcicella hirudinis]
MEVFRLAREKYAAPLSGIGAAIKGARWNSIGIELIYTAQNRSLAMAEVAVHFTLATLPDDYVMLTIDIPDDIATKQISETDLPPDWKNFPHPISTQKFGDEFVAENTNGVLIIPSVVTQGDYNVLINPNHKDFSRITIKKIEKFPFDMRIFKG